MTNSLPFPRIVSRESPEEEYFESYEATPFYGFRNEKEGLVRHEWAVFENLGGTERTIAEGRASSSKRAQAELDDVLTEIAVDLLKLRDQTVIKSIGEGKVPDWHQPGFAMQMSLPYTIFGIGIEATFGDLSTMPLARVGRREWAEQLILTLFIATQDEVGIQEMAEAHVFRQYAFGKVDRRFAK